MTKNKIHVFVGQAKQQYDKDEIPEDAIEDLKSMKEGIWCDDPDADAKISSYITN